MGYIKEIWAKPHILGKLTKCLGKHSKKWGYIKRILVGNWEQEAAAGACGVKKCGRTQETRDKSALLRNTKMNTGLFLCSSLT
jgi:DNA replication protein DnaD